MLHPPDTTLGAMYIGTILASILYGVTNFQVYVYYSAYPEDRRLHKIAVAILWFLDSLHLFMAVHATYHYLISRLGLPPGNLVWSIKLHVLLIVIIVMIVQSMYALRLWKLGNFHHGPLRYISAGVVIIGFAIGLALSVGTFMLTDNSAINTISWAVVASIGMATGIDFVLAVAICYYLGRSRTKLLKMNSRITSIMQYSVISGLATSQFHLRGDFIFNDEILCQLIPGNVEHEATRG